MCVCWFEYTGGLLALGMYLKDELQVTRPFIRASIFGSLLLIAALGSEVVRVLCYCTSVFRYLYLMFISLHTSVLSIFKNQLLISV